MPHGSLLAWRRKCGAAFHILLSSPGIKSGTRRALRASMCATKEIVRLLFTRTSQPAGRELSVNAKLLLRKARRSKKAASGPKTQASGARARSEQASCPVAGHEHDRAYWGQYLEAAHMEYWPPRPPQLCLAEFGVRTEAEART